MKMTESIFLRFRLMRPYTKPQDLFTSLSIPIFNSKLNYSMKTPLTLVFHTNWPYAFYFATSVQLFDQFNRNWDKLLTKYTSPTAFASQCSCRNAIVVCLLIGVNLRSVCLSPRKIRNKKIIMHNNYPVMHSNNQAIDACFVSLCDTDNHVVLSIQHLFICVHQNYA